MAFLIDVIDIVQWSSSTTNLSTKHVSGEPAYEWGTPEDLLQLGKQPRRRAVTVPQRPHKQSNGSHTSCPSSTNSPDDVYIMPISSSSASVSLSSVMSLEDDGDYAVPTATLNEASGTVLTLPASY